MIDKRSPKGFFLKVLGFCFVSFVLVLHVTVFVLRIFWGRRGVLGVVPGFLASSAPPASAPHLVPLPCWCWGFLLDEIRLFRVRKKKELLMALPQAYLWFQSWEATADAITTISMQQLLGPGPNCPLGFMSLFLLPTPIPAVCSLLRFALILLPK